MTLLYLITIRCPPPLEVSRKHSCIYTTDVIENIQDGETVTTCYSKVSYYHLCVLTESESV